MSLLADMFDFLTHRPKSTPPRPRMDTLRERERVAEKCADAELLKLKATRMRYDTRKLSAAKIESLLDQQDQLVEEALGERRRTGDDDQQ